MITPEKQVLNELTTADSVFLPVGFIDLEATLDGGQAFRWWRQQDGAYRGVVGRRVVPIIEADGGLLIIPREGPGPRRLQSEVGRRPLPWTGASRLFGAAALKTGPLGVPFQLYLLQYIKHPQNQAERRCCVRNAWVSDRA